MPARRGGNSGGKAENDRAPQQCARSAQSTSLIKRTAWAGECWENATWFGEFLQQSSGVKLVMRVVSGVVRLGRHPHADPLPEGEGGMGQ